MENLINNLINLPEMGIYGLLNKIDNKIYIGFSKNIVTALIRLINNIKYSNIKHDLNKLEFIIIETINKPEELRLRCQHWINDYSNKGFGLYNNKRKVFNQKLRICAISSLDGAGRPNYHLHVRIVSKGYRELTVGVFNDVSELNEFVDKNYKVIDKIVYADNRLTKEYLNVR